MTRNYFPDLHFGGFQIAAYIRGAAIFYRHLGLCQIYCGWWLLAARFAEKIMIAGSRRNFQI